MPRFDTSHTPVVPTPSGEPALRRQRGKGGARLGGKSVAEREPVKKRTHERVKAHPRLSRLDRWKRTPKNPHHGRTEAVGKGATPKGPPRKKVSRNKRPGHKLQRIAARHRTHR